MSARFHLVALALAAVALGLLATWLIRPPGPPVGPTPPPTPTATPTAVPTPVATTPPMTPARALVPCSMPLLSDDLDEASLDQAIGHSLTYLGRRRDSEALTFGPDRVPVARARASLVAVREALQKLRLSPAFYEWLGREMVCYESSAPSVLFTGYYLCSLPGSKHKTKRYKYPLYRTPDDLIRVNLAEFPFYRGFVGLPPVIRGRLHGRVVRPYWTRAQIDYDGKLAKRGLELAWVDSLVRQHDLHVQGSGVVELEGGGQLRVGYADGNGHEYVSVGKYLIATGALTPDTVSMQSIRRYLDKDRPDRQREVLGQDTSYVFFRVIEGGPYGCLDVALTPWRSIATDRTLMPPAGLCLVETQRPVIEGDRIVGWKTFRRFMLNQDTGGAIRSPGRVDLYCGYGPEAELTAGNTKNPGRLWFLLKR